MYAIRSYYVVSGIMNSFLFALAAFSIISMMMSMMDVITSYSIHYTKLYEKKAFTLSPFEELKTIVDSVVDDPGVSGS